MATNKPTASPTPTPKPTPEWKPANLWWLMFALVALFWMRDLWVTTSQVQPIPYSEFIAHLKAGRMESVSIGSQFIDGKLKAPTADGRSRIVTTRVAPDLARELAQYDVRFEGVVENTLLRDLLSWVVPALLLLAVWNFMSKRMAAQGGLGGLLSVGKSRAKLHSETDVKVSFDDVAGVDEAKAELRESVDFLKNPEGLRPAGRAHAQGHPAGRPARHRQDPAGAGRGRRGRRAVLHHHRLGVRRDVRRRRRRAGARPVRAGARRRRRASSSSTSSTRSAAPAASGPVSGGHDEKEQTLNQLLAEMDGFDASSGVVILAATNRPEILDPALLRAGRFDRQVLVDRPDRKGRADVLRVHLKKVTLGRGHRRRRGGGAHTGLRRRRSRQPGQRGRAAGDAARRRRGGDGRLHRRGRAHRRRPGAAPACARRQGAPHGGGTTRWATRWWR